MTRALSITWEPITLTSGDAQLIYRMHHSSASKAKTESDHYNQSEQRKMSRAAKLSKAGENAGDRVVVGFGFVFD